MRGGDISNEAPPRLYVTLESVGKVTVKEERKFLRTTVTHSVEWNLRELNHVWNIRDRYGVVAALLIFGDIDKDPLIEELEERGINPFNYAETYGSIEKFLSDMPYFFNVVGVVDTPDRVARYGSLGIELNRL